MMIDIRDHGGNFSGSADRVDYSDIIIQRRARLLISSASIFTYNGEDDGIAIVATNNAGGGFRIHGFKGVDSYFSTTSNTYEAKGIARDKDYYYTVNSYQFKQVKIPLKGSVPTELYGIALLNADYLPYSNPIMFNGLAILIRADATSIVVISKGVKGDPILIKSGIFIKEIIADPNDSNILYILHNTGIIKFNFTSKKIMYDAINTSSDSGNRHLKLYKNNLYFVSTQRFYKITTDGVFIQNELVGPLALHVDLYGNIILYNNDDVFITGNGSFGNIPKNKIGDGSIAFSAINKNFMYSVAVGGYFDSVRYLYGLK